MTEDDYIAQLRTGWPKDSDASLEVIALADEAVRSFPQSARLWVMRGDLIQIGPECCPHPLDEALRSYQRAIELDPQFAEAWDEIGHYHDTVLDDETEAQRCFREAERLRGHLVG
jgi:tetratricopeptide (TPR) repeat protein